MSNAYFLGWFGFGSMYYNAGGVGNAFGPFCPLVYKHRITGLKKKKKRRTNVQHFFPSCVGSSTWSPVIGQQNHLRNALHVSDMLFLVASRVDMNKRYGPMFSLLGYASDVYGSFWLSLIEEQESQVQPQVICLWYVMIFWWWQVHKASSNLWSDREKGLVPGESWLFQ